MKTISITACCSFVLLFSAATSRAALPLTAVSIDTTALRGLAGPFYLDFQFTDGSGVGDANNTVDIPAVYLSGAGSWTDSPVITGGASGGWFSFDLRDTAFFNEIYQQFTPGISINLALSMTGVVDTGGIPDEFRLAILDPNKIEIPTTGPGDAFIVVDIDFANPTIQTFGSDTSRTDILIPVPSVGGGLPVPESSMPVAFTALLWAAGLLIHRARRL